ncbi:hypothetical protein LB524_18690 [Mesorhizobium sp. ESP6-5]|uniref:hypothetical protein n=1 Tax=Mesorhizobium sp. ESP6-5 TaxID=2876623 RepID=UPI001CCC679D|nr:hypothetical protein [Mesorhizobium sp. ESP6-5]MBZ9757316.1 hypothetical protein [Mesorhizobium sp. ESP6-5]
MSTVGPSEDQIKIDKVRASKAGHAFHEAWAARSALELLLPHTELVAITLEGFDERDEAELGTGAVEIADLVRYFGASDTARASRVEVVQFKYSIASADKPVRAADLATTLTKFAETDKELRARHGEDHIAAVVRYDYATNRPIHPNLATAIAAAREGEARHGDIGRQQEQINAALEGYPHPAHQLLERLSLSGTLGSLSNAERGTAALLASWSEPSDPDAEKRLLKLRNLIRVKAGPGSETDKRVDRVAVLAELDVDHEERLYPTPDAFPEVGTVIARSVLDTIVGQARVPGLPLVLHATGGMGKTVLMQGVAERLGADGPVVLFDGFGAGRWRDLADGRHRPERTLVHLANLLAGQGLCDILLPITDVTSLLRGFRRRLEQAVATARQGLAEATVTLVLDAIDHAGLAAKEFGTQSFAHVLMRSLSVDPIEGVRVIASCRPERLAVAVGDNAHRTFPVPPFTETEAKALIKVRAPDAHPDEVAALLSRSGRNPRCLDTLLDAGRPYDPHLMPGNDDEPAKDVLDALLAKRLDDARRAAIGRGASSGEIDLLLAGLALLAPPVPINELAAAYGLTPEQVESFAADLAPLLERTPYGLMFRDEPTETLIRNSYGRSAPDTVKVVATLQARQSVSNYAARALPALLTALRYADQLIALAFDTRVPKGASQVSARDIRLARITAALALTAELRRRDDLVRLLLEASLVAAGHERSDRFLYEHPDLAAVAGDAEVLRRLAVTSVGWPGGKHAALALANVFAGEMGEARRHARRSIDWHNWAAQPRRKPSFGPNSISRDWDDVGFAYVEMLAGNDIRVARFFAGRGDAEAFGKFDDLLDLFERHRVSAYSPAARIAERLARCRLPSRSLWAAALRHSSTDPAYDRRLIKRFAAAGAAKEKSEALAIASIRAAARAFALDMEAEALAILDGAGLAPPNIHDYASYWPVDRSAEVAVLAAGVRAAIRGRRATLMDMAPSELLALVPRSAQAKGPATFGRVLKSKLANLPHDGTRRRRRRTGLDTKQRDDYSRTLDRRIGPLVAYAQMVANVLRPPGERSREAMVHDSFDALARDVREASDYPYRDGKAYLARAGFRVIFTTADALGLIDRGIADVLVDWLASAPGLFIPDLTEVVARLSRTPSCHIPALRLAGEIEKRILLDTDVTSRVSAYGQLARAVWRMGTEEAAVYFRRALDLAEAIGSDDFDRTNHLLEISGHYTGAELSPAASHALARILELNQSEDSKFPWIEYAASMTPTAGLAILATVARLDDRDVARLGLSLGPALTVLLRSGKFPADLATAILGLAEPLETWTWHMSDFAAEAVARTPADQLHWLFDVLVEEIDRSDQLSPSSMAITRLRTLAEQYLPPHDRLRLRIEALAARTNEEPSSPTRASAMEPRKPSPYPAPFREPDAIDRAILSEEVGPSGQRWPVRTLVDIAAQSTTPAARLEFVRAVVESSVASLADKVNALDDLVAAWSEESPALYAALPGLALRLAEKHPRELANSSVDAWGGWRGLIRDFNADRGQLVERVVSALGSNTQGLGGNAWLALAAQMAPSASSEALAEGLERFLTLSNATLPTEVGDGPWNPRFAAPADVQDAVAGLLWARLGQPEAAARWRAAHAVRRLAIVGRFDVIDKLVSRFDHDQALPFCDAKLPFYPLHARLWLLIALARIARDAPAAVINCRPLLEKVAFSSDFPHVVMRATAIDALRRIAPAVESGADRAALLARLDKANRSPFPYEPKTNYGEKRFIQRPKASLRPADGFYLDYDFIKYQVERLCRVFGCAGWEVEDLIYKRVRLWDAKVSGMNECPRSATHDASWSSGYVPNRDRYGGYLGWHGLMLAAGEMLATRAVTGQDWGGDAWDAFLAEYQITRSDGLWLADATDLFPLDLPSELALAVPDAGERSRPADDYRLLAPLLGVNEKQLKGDWMPVAGYWSITNDLNIAMRSVLANARDARNIVMAVLAEEPFSRWLPDDDDEITRLFGDNGHSVRAWIDRDQHSERKFDRQDPYAATSAHQRPRPVAWVRDALGLSPDDTVPRSWSREQRLAFQAEAWGVEGGRGEHAWEINGARLLGHRDVIFDLLEKTELQLIGTPPVRAVLSAEGEHRKS